VEVKRTSTLVWYALLAVETLMVPVWMLAEAVATLVNKARRNE
jgi:hypothetical protein